MFDIFKAIQGKVKEHHGKFPAKDSCVAFYDGKVINIRGSLDDFKRAYDRILKGTCSDADIQKVHTLFHEFEHMFCFENGIHQEFQLFGTGNHNNVISEICNEIRARARFKSMFPEMELFLDKGNGAYVRRCYDFERLITRFGIDYDKLCSDMLTLKGHYVSDLAKLLTKHSTKGLKVEWFEEFLKNYFACGEDFDKRFGTVLKGRDYAEKMLRQAKLIKRGEVATPPPDQWFLDWANPRVGYRPFEQLKKKHADLIAKGTGGLERTAKAADAIHLARLDSVGRQVDKVYRDAAREASRIGALVGGLSPDKPFSFDDFPNVRKRAEEMLQQFRDGLEGVIVNGIRSEWTLANNKNDEISRMVFGTQVGKLSQEQYRRYFSTNGEARDAFIARRDAGMNLSDRVWNLQSQFKCEMETVLDIGIRNGLSAEEMQRDLQQYLKNPDNYFRRFRYKEGQDENGNPIYKRKWKKRYWDESSQGYRWEDVDINDPKYRYGRGVYRSSYKNARRLAATETNIAYRTADYLRWQQLDFVVGIHIEPSSTNHPVPDICDELAGDYPKDFKWTGWHPHCRCHATSILKTEEEMAADNARILAGEDIEEGGENEITELPDNFKQWLEDNRERAKGWSTMPYFVRDNEKYTGEFVVNTYDQSERKFTRALKTKDAMFEAVSTLSVKYPEIPNTELAAIYHFTRGDVSAFRQLNNQLRKGGLNEFNEAFSTLMERGLEKIEPITAVSYRTMRLNKGQLRDWLSMANAETPEVVTFKGFTSSSLDRSIAEGFAEAHKGRKKNETDILLTIRGKSGRPIEGISQFGVRDNGLPNQREVIFIRGKRFRVLSYRPLEHGACGYEFEIEEI